MVKESFLKLLCRRAWIAMVVMKRLLIGLLSLISWLFLLLAILATALTLTINSLNHVGNTASIILNDFSNDPVAVNSLFDEFTKGSDPKVATDLQKNKAQIVQAIRSLTGSNEFRDATAFSINQIFHGVLSGASTVKVDFSRVVTLIATKVNEVAKSTVIKKSDLAKIKPTVVNIEKQSTVIARIRNSLRIAMLLWIAWIALMVALFYLRGKKVIKSAGMQLISMAILYAAIKFAAPVVLARAAKNSTMPIFAQGMLPKVVNLLTVTTFDIALVAFFSGCVLVSLWQFLKRADRRKTQTLMTSGDIK